MSAIGACFSKNGQYTQQPFSQKQEVVSEAENTTTQEDMDKRKEMQLKLLFARLDVMGQNANLAKARKEAEEKKRKEMEENGIEPEIDMDNFEPYDLGEG